MYKIYIFWVPKFSFFFILYKIYKSDTREMILTVFFLNNSHTLSLTFRKFALQCIVKDRNLNLRQKAKIYKLNYTYKKNKMAVKTYFKMAKHLLILIIKE